VRMTDSLGFNNSYAIGVKQSLARQLDLHRISDLKNHPELVFGFGNEFMNRADGWPAHIFLLFIAFNFTISNQLPRLGYITFMDAYLVSTFIITSIVVLINVQLRRQKKLGHIEVTETIDHYVLWAYPLIYIFGAIITFGIYIIN
jgi:glycine betaine/choline ABC-type transport system substrate-binding protein